ncbi:NUDIX hydrolase [Haloprofundus halophilus]|uniref:NUDIX hydrolase n=1 Tax=Haloprofundus halophilus TaxID=2283527 RepID=UPI0037447860
MNDDADADADGGTANDGSRLDWETTDSRIDYSCPGFDVRMDDVRLPDGTETDFHYVDEPPAVVILPFTPDGDVVLVEEWRQAVGHVNRGLPAGGTEPDDDDFAAAAHRELAEETGYEAESMEKFYVAEPANGIANSVHHYFVARGCESTAEQELDFNESIRPTTTSYEDLLASVVDNEILDGRTSLGVLQYELARP